MTADRNAPFDIAHTTVGLLRDGDAILIENVPGPPARVDGYTVSGPKMSEPAPHDGELHPDADELLIVVSGRITVLLEEPEGERRAEVLPGQGFVVPRGVWHRVLIDEPTQLIAMTPGPRGEHRLRSEVR